MKNLLLMLLIAPVASQAATIYQCKSYGGSIFWSQAHCQQHKALIERMASVPDGMPFQQQVDLASREANASTIRQQQEVQGLDRQNRCARLQYEKNQIDSRYTNWQWQPPEVINPDQQRWRGIRAEQQRLGCPTQ